MIYLEFGLEKLNPTMWDFKQTLL